jgi:hypothetical protein
MSAGMQERLIAASEAGQVLPEAEDYLDPHFEGDEAEAAARWIEANPGHSAFHLLMTLERWAPDVYAGIPAEVRAKVLAATLAEHRQLNDFGYLAPDGSYDGPAALALVELGRAAIPALRPLLDDTSKAFVSGSEEATMAKLYGYRRADFAFRYLAQILGEDPTFEKDPARRDEAIAALRAKLG